MQPRLWTIKSCDLHMSVTVAAEVIATRNVRIVAVFVWMDGNNHKQNLFSC